MKLVTFQVPGQRPTAGVVVNGHVLDIHGTALLGPRVPAWLATGPLDMIALVRHGEEALDLVRSLVDGTDAAHAIIYPLAGVTLLPPVPRPASFLDFYTFEQHVSTCRAKRGADVPREWFERPVYYRGNSNTLLGPGAEVRFPPGETQRDYELELGVILGRGGQDLSPEEAAGCIAGYTIVNDWSARALQRQVMAVGLGPSPGKDFATSVGPYLVTPDEVGDPRALTMVARINGEEWSRGRSGDAQYTFAEMIAFASRCTPLQPGDLIASGTVGTGCGLEQDRFLNPGDTVELEIDRLGILTGKVAE